MSSFVSGRQAEQAAADYLINSGYTIFDKNWRTRYCEIDIIAQKDQVIYFVEVKYRKSSEWGGGLDYITAKKLNQMSFAADMWVSLHNFSGDFQLAAIEVSGSDFTVTAFLKDF